MSYYVNYSSVFYLFILFSSEVHHIVIVLFFQSKTAAINGLGVRKTRDKLLQKVYEYYIQVNLIFSKNIKFQSMLYFLKENLNWLFLMLKIEAFEFKVSISCGKYIGIIACVLRIFFMLLANGVMLAPAVFYLIVMIIGCIVIIKVTRRLLIWQASGFWNKAFETRQKKYLVCQADLSPLIFLASMAGILKKRACVEFFAEFPMLLRLCKEGFFTLSYGGQRWKEAVVQLELIEDTKQLVSMSKAVISPIEQKIQPNILNGLKGLFPRHNLVTHGENDTGVFVTCASDKGKFLFHEYMQKSHLEAQSGFGILKKSKEIGGIDFVSVDTKAVGLGEICESIKIDAKTIMTPPEHLEVEGPESPEHLRAYDITFLKFSSEKKGLQILQELDQAHQKSGWKRPLYSSDSDIIGYDEIRPVLMAKLEFVEELIEKNLASYPGLSGLVNNAPAISNWKSGDKPFGRYHQEYFEKFFDANHKTQTSDLLDTIIKLTEGI